jgi:hypothetical protein
MHQQMYLASADAIHLYSGDPNLSNLLCFEPQSVQHGLSAFGKPGSTSIKTWARIDAASFAYISMVLDSFGN